jgi:translation initiation factor IF-3
MMGVVSISEAMSMAVRSGQDLVEVSPNAEPPVCRIMDYGKFKYEQARKEREARKHQHAAEMKEMKFHANVGDHDFDTKVRHILEFLEDGIKVKCSLFFRGRENAHRELGFDVMNRVLKACSEQAQTDMLPRLIGNSIVMVLSPKSGKTPARESSGGKLGALPIPAPSAPPPAAAPFRPAPPAAAPFRPAPPATAPFRPAPPASTAPAPAVTPQK